ncbi:MAG: DUF3617 family protein [Pseudomonadota bacterium]
MRLLIISLAVGTSFAGAASAQETISIEPGQWVFENTMSGSADMGGGQTFTMPSRTFNDTECIRPEDATLTPEQMIEDMQEDGGSECQYSEIEMSGLTMSTTITCIQDGMQMVGDYTYTVSEDRRSGVGSLALNGNANGMVITSNFTMSGTHQGPCS